LWAWDPTQNGKDKRADVTTGQVSLSNGTLQRKRTANRDSAGTTGNRSAPALDGVQAYN
jgi:hypothetical protein